jgi:hypothetical protein
MIIYVGFLYIILSSIYTISYAGQSWKENNKKAAIGAVLLVFLSMAVAIVAYLRT